MCAPGSACRGVRGAPPGATIDAMDHTLHLAQQPDADALLSRSPLALLVGSLLDQQVPMERAFAGPYELNRRLGDDGLDARAVAAMDPEELEQLFSEKPAVHRFPGSMAKRVQQLCQYLVEHYDGSAETVWEGASDGRDLLRRLKALPGYGDAKAQIFVALLGKQLGVRPQGWREAAGPYGEDGTYRSAADVTGPETLEKVRAEKKEQKAKGR